LAELGKIETLRVVKKVDFGIYLDGDELGEILLPLKEVPTVCEEDDELEVFIYLDSEDRVIATRKKPTIAIGEAAMLKAIDITTIGAFFDWGLEKDLLVPYAEQTIPARNGNSYPVTVYLDNSGRLTGSMRIDKHIKPSGENLEENQECDILIYGKTDLGYKAVIDRKDVGLLYANEVYRELKIGEHCSAFINKIREDGKIDLRLGQAGIKRSETLAERILSALEKEETGIKLNDKSSPEEIRERFQSSKKDFKRAIGMLYKQKKIYITKLGIKLVR